MVSPVMFASDFCTISARDLNGKAVFPIMDASVMPMTMSVGYLSCFL